MIYATPFDPETRLCTAASVETGFQTLEEATTATGEPSRRYRAMVIYPGLIFTRFAWNVENERQNEGV